MPAVIFRGHYRFLPGVSCMNGSTTPAVFPDAPFPLPRATSREQQREGSGCFWTSTSVFRYAGWWRATSSPAPWPWCRAPLPAEQRRIAPHPSWTPSPTSADAGRFTSASGAAGRASSRPSSPAHTAAHEQHGRSARAFWCRCKSVRCAASSASPGCCSRRRRIRTAATAANAGAAGG